MKETIGGRAEQKARVCDKAIVAGASASASLGEANSHEESRDCSPVQWYARVMRWRERR